MVNDPVGIALNADGNTLTLGGSGITLNASAGTAALNAALALGASQTWTNNMAISPSSTGVTLTVDTQTYSPTFRGIISGSGGLTKISNGVLTLTANNTYTGVTTVNGDTLQTPAGNSATGAVGPSASIVVNSGAIQDGSSLVIGAGGTFVFDLTATGSALASSSPSLTVAPVPEPGTLVLLSVAGIVAAAAVWRKRRK